jgi:moderate conductance mechanosensitive channel
VENFANAIAAFFVRNIQVIFDILIIIILAGISVHLLRGLRKKIEVKLIEQRVDMEKRARLTTLLRAGLGMLQVVVIGIAVLMILLQLNINITPLLASAGVAGLAISLGAQTLIKDYIGGTLILFENQFNVGDDIQVGTFSGTVERIELRATYIRDSDGKLIIIPNGDVRIVSNKSRDWSSPLLDLNIAFDADFSRVLEVLDAAIQKASQDEALKLILLEAPKIQGWNGMNDWAIQVRLSAKTLPNKQSMAASILRKYALQALADAGISLALPPGSPVNSR